MKQMLEVFIISVLFLLNVTLFLQIAGARQDISDAKNFAVQAEQRLNKYKGEVNRDQIINNIKQDAVNNGYQADISVKSSAGFETVYNFEVKYPVEIGLLGIAKVYEISNEVVCNAY